MKTAYIKLFQLLMFATLGASLTACDNVVFSDSGGKNTKIDGGGTTGVGPDDEAGGGTTGVGPDDEAGGGDDGNTAGGGDDGNTGGGGDDVAQIDDLVFINDSFERNDIFMDIDSDMIFGWRGFILDGSDPIFGFSTPSGAGARIPPAGEFGPAAAGERFLLLNGDADQDLETIHVISQSYDLALYNTVVLSFRYLTFNLNDPTDTAPERLELQVCRGTLNDCGANDDALNVAGLTSNNWVTVFTNDQNVNDDSLDGKNHSVSDWQQALAVIDLRNPELIGDGSTFVFRFRAAMTDGLSQGECTEVCEDVLECKSKGKKCTHKKKNENKKSKSSSKKIIKVELTGREVFLKDIVGTSKEDKYAKKYACDKEKTGSKVKVCHVPPGNPAASHAICIGRPALRAHAHHGHNKYGIRDYFGDCTHKVKYKEPKKDHDHKDCKKKRICTQECTEGDGTLRDGVGIDSVLGRATVLTIEDIF